MDKGPFRAWPHRIGKIDNPDEIADVAHMHTCMGLEDENRDKGEAEAEEDEVSCRKIYLFLRAQDRQA